MSLLYELASELDGLRKVVAGHSLQANMLRLMGVPEVAQANDFPFKRKLRIAFSFFRSWGTPSQSPDFVSAVRGSICGEWVMQMVPHYPPCRSMMVRLNMFEEIWARQARYIPTSGTD